MPKAAQPPGHGGNRHTKTNPASHTTHLALRQPQYALQPTRSMPWTAKLRFTTGVSERDD